MKKILKIFTNDLDIKKQSEELGISFWQTPSFLFILMGLVIIAVMTAVYFISKRYDSPEFLVISESIVVVVIFTIGNFIIRSVEQIAKMNKMKSEFVSIASHQLKTPLAEINWEVELLMSKNREGMNEKQKEIIKGISKSNSRMTRLVNDLLDVARIEQRRLALSREKADILKLVDSVVENNKILAQANNVEIKVERLQGLPEIVVDRRRIGVVIDNLLSNAIKYIKGKGQVKVKVEKEKGLILISVKDNGIGIPRHQQKNVFEKFFRSDNVSRYQVSGTGLGLYIAKNIVEQSGGKIWFKSKEGAGSTFYFTLPLKVTRNQ